MQINLIAWHTFLVNSSFFLYYFSLSVWEIVRFCAWRKCNRTAFFFVVVESIWEIGLCGALECISIVVGVSSFIISFLFSGGKHDDNDKRRLYGMYTCTCIIDVCYNTTSMTWAHTSNARPQTHSHTNTLAHWVTVTHICYLHTYMATYSHQNIFVHVGCTQHSHINSHNLL